MRCGYANAVFSVDDLYLLVLDDTFLENKRSMYRKLMNYFDKGAWAAVLEILNKHQEHATCPVCLQLCLENCICCDVCSYWYHFECYDASPYHKSGNVKKWTCSKYGLKCSV